MINFTFKGHKINIRNDDWKKLKERLNPDNAKRDRYGDFSINIKCPFCPPDSFSGCVGCPFEKMERFGCDTILNSFFKKRYFNTGYKTKISWLKKDNSQARRQLKAILRRMEKIEASQ